MNTPLPLEAQLSLYNDVACRDTGQYFCTTRPFSMPRMGNKMTLLSSGQEVMESIYNAMMAAENFIWIADWQMAHDVELVRPKGRDKASKAYPGRLHQIIEDIISTKPVHIRILLFRSIKDTIPGTYDGLVKRRLNGLNKKGYPGSVQVALQSPTSSQNDSIDYSHHQKFVVVDGKVGFIGGIDLSYGRWETPAFDVVIDPENYIVNEMYNPNVKRLRALSPRENEKIEKYRFEKPYGGKVIDEGCQPRMPWQDVHTKLEGPSVVDIHRNFVRRWNMQMAVERNNSGYVGMMVPSAFQSITKKWLESIGAWTKLKSAQASRAGGAQVQVVRSVSRGHLAAEGTNPDDLLLYPNLNEQKTWSQCLKNWQGSHQSNILDAVVNCINSADNYVYIETQFFISRFGIFGENIDSDKIGNENDGIQNTVVDALANRIAKHIAAGTPFHVYLVIPVHPEGLVGDEAVWKQQWLALTTIKHGSNSLINRIKRSLQRKKRDPQEWNQYLTVLNMRNFGATVQYARDPSNYAEDYTREIGRFVVTEQIYIHSKLIIVDDAVAIIGSANTNDRSLTGNGDSEIAVVVVDTEDVELRDLGSPTMKVQTRGFARNLRRSLWEKHFGFHIKEDSSNSYFRSTDRATRAGFQAPKMEHPPRQRTSSARFVLASDVSWESVLDTPCSPISVEAIQKIANNNAHIYEEVFQHVPRNSFSKFSDTARFFKLPYAPLFNVYGSNALESASSKIVRSNVSPSKRNEIIDRRRAFYDQQINEAGNDEKLSGVTPPPLNASFMTTILLPHQESTIKEVIYYRRLQMYEGRSVHDVIKAVERLKNGLIGFLVAAPLDWGMKAKPGDPTKATTIKVDIAINKNVAENKHG